MSEQPKTVDASTLLDSFIQTQQNQLNIVRALIRTVREQQGVKPENLTSLEDVTNE